jgi:hypothetical protein
LTVTSHRLTSEARVEREWVRKGIVPVRRSVTVPVYRMTPRETWAFRTYQSNGAASLIIAVVLLLGVGSAYLGGMPEGLALAVAGLPVVLCAVSITSYAKARTVEAEADARCAALLEADRERNTRRTTMADPRPFRPAGSGQHAIDVGGTTRKITPPSAQAQPAPVPVEAWVEDDEEALA